MNHGYIKTDKITKKLSFGQFFKKVLPFFITEKWRALTVLALLVCTTTVARFIPLTIGHIVDLISLKHTEQIFQVAMFFLVLRAIYAILEFLITYKVHQFGNRVLYNIREHVMKHLQALPITYFDKTPVGRTVTRVTNDVLSLGVVLTEGLTGVILNIFELGAILVTMLILSPLLTGILIVFLPLGGWIAISISRKLRDIFQDGKRKMAEINAYSAETLNGIKVIQVYNQESVRRKQFHKISDERLKIDLLTVKYFAQLWPLMSFFNFSTLCIAIFFGALLYEDLGFTIGKLSAFLFLAQSFFPPMRNLLERYNQYQDALAGADRVFQLLDEIPEDGSEYFQPASEHLEGGIEFKNVSFRYESTGPYILKNINLKIEPGQSVALVGRTGSGKTTITSLIQKFYKINKGEILIDGQPISQYTPYQLRSRIGTVMQDNFIFKGTIKSNITLADTEMSEKTIRNAARRAHCSKIIESRKGGLDATVEERGANLSTGEKQLISFARALAHNPDILILDEATANIDSQNEKLIQQSIEEITSTRTSLIVAHRLSTILHCDRIVLLDKGQIIEQGSHEELIESKGSYYDLYRSQFQ